MKTLAFLDCPTGISGDMCLGALVDAGVPLEYLQTQLARLELPEPYTLRAESVRCNGMAATHVQVILGAGGHGSSDPQGARESGGDRAATPPQWPDHPPHRDLPHHQTAAAQAQHSPAPVANREHDREHNHPPQRHLGEIVALIQRATLPPRAIAWSVAVFQCLAKAEGAVHGIDPNQVHFHEVGATDAIVDIVGTCLGLDWLGVEALYCGPLPVGAGTVATAHGRLPVPAPAVLKLLEQAQAPIYSNGLQGELVTPTGAAIATTLAQGFTPPPTMVLQRVGLGAGSRNLPLPNLLRLWLGQAPEGATLAPGAGISGTVISGITDNLPDPQAQSQPMSWMDSAAIPLTPKGFPTETVILLETQVDDLTPQAIGYVSDRLFQLGALDVFTQGIAMKKSRPGHLITVIAPPDKADLCSHCLFTETTTLGIRCQPQQRLYLRREHQEVTTPHGPVGIKVAYDPTTGAVINAHPEYEDCARLAQRHNLPWRTIHLQALCQWQQQGQWQQ